MSAGLRLILAAALLGNGAAQASPTVVEGFRRWTAGWDYSSEPLNYLGSGLYYTVNPVSKTITLNIRLSNAKPNKSYQIAPHFFCNTFPATFGQFPNTNSGGGSCGPLSRQGVTANIAVVELGVVTTDEYGNGSVAIEVGPVAPGTYNFELVARNGTGCNLSGGGNDSVHCQGDF